VAQGQRPPRQHLRKPFNERNVIQLHCVVTPDTYTHVLALADEHGVPIGTMLRDIITAHLRRLSKAETTQ